jgi:hypothetical protein
MEVKMGYYEELNKMSNQLELILKEFKIKKRPINKTDLIYNLTKSFKISEKAILRKIEILEEMGKVKIKENNFVEWV